MKKEIRTFRSRSRTLFSSEIGFIGLGKMGSQMVRRLRKKGWRVIGFDTQEKVSDVSSLRALTEQLRSPRLVWCMVPPGSVDTVLATLIPYLEKGDLVIDGGNSYYQDSIRRSSQLKRKGMHFLDVGVSGGPVSLRLGKFALMVGGERRIYEKYRMLFGDLSDTPSGYMGKSGAGHFAKMVHNGIEYGMMQALAEGFAILKKSPFHFRLKDVAAIYNSNSIITSRLVGWLREVFQAHGDALQEASGAVAHTGEGEWTVKTAKELKVAVPVIRQALLFRVHSHKHPTYTGKILSALRNQFGGHPWKSSQNKPKKQQR